MKIHDFNKIVKGNPTEFNGFYQVWENFRHSIDPCERGEVTCCLAANLVTNFEANGECSQVPRDAKDDDIPSCSINDVGIHFKCRETLPFLVLVVP